MPSGACQLPCFMLRRLPAAHRGALFPLCCPPAHWPSGVCYLRASPSGVCQLFTCYQRRRPATCLCVLYTPQPNVQFSWIDLANGAADWRLPATCIPKRRLPAVPRLKRRWPAACFPRRGPTTTGPSCSSRPAPSSPWRRPSLTLAGVPLLPPRPHVMPRSARQAASSDYPCWVGRSLSLDACWLASMAVGQTHTGSRWRSRRHAKKPLRRIGEACDPGPAPAPTWHQAHACEEVSSLCPGFRPV